MIGDVIPYRRFPIGRVGGKIRWKRCPDVRKYEEAESHWSFFAKKAGARVVSPESDLLWQYTMLMFSGKIHMS